jgi:hypothetical protein
MKKVNFFNPDLNKTKKLVINGNQCYGNSNDKIEPRIEDNEFYGKIIFEDDKEIIISWDHYENTKIEQKYIKISEDTFIKLISYEDFNTGKYVAYNSDFINNKDKKFLYDHYINFGIKEGRIYNGYKVKDNKIVFEKQPLPEDFDSNEYKLMYSDIAQLTDDELKSHYVNHGYYEKRMYKNLYSKKEVLYPYFLSPVFINHDISLTGAPIFLYDWVQYLKENNIVKNPIIIEAYKNNLFEYNIKKEYHENNIDKLVEILNKINPVFIYSNSLNLFYCNTNKLEKFLYKTYFHMHETLNYIKNIDGIRNQKIFVVADKIKNQLNSKSCKNVNIFPPFIPKEKIFNIEDLSNKHTDIKNKSRHLDKNKVVIGMSGTISERKNFILFYELAKRYDNYEFLWIGGSRWKQEFKKLCKQKPVDLLNFFHIPHTNNPYKYYKIIDYFFLTSKNDPCPIVVLENLLLNNRVIVIKDNIFYDHEKELLKENYIEIEAKNQEDAINIFGSLTLEKYQKNFLGEKYILSNFSEPRLLVENKKEKNYLLFNYYHKKDCSNDIGYFVNLINNFNINNNLCYKVIINININNINKGMYFEKQQFYKKKYKKLFEEIINLDRIIFSNNYGWDISGLIKLVSVIYNDYKFDKQTRVAYIHNKSNLLWREKLNKIFYLNSQELKDYDTAVSDEFFVNCDLGDLNRKIMKDDDILKEISSIKFKYVQGTIFISKLDFLSPLYYNREKFLYNTTKMSSKNHYWINAMKNDNVFNQYYEYYKNNAYNQPIDIESTKIVKEGLAFNFLDLYSKFDKRGIPDLHFEHAMERYIGYLISNKRKVKTI